MPFSDDISPESAPTAPYYRPVPRRPVPDPGTRAAVRTLRLAAVALFVVLVGTAVFVTTRIVRADRAGPVSRPARVIGPVTTVSDRFVEIGPLSGVDVETYTTERRQALARADGERVAVVSLRSYLTEDAVRRQLGALEVIALLVAAPGGTPTAVVGSMDDWAEEQRRADTTEREELRKLIPTTDDPAFRADYEAEVARLDKTIEAIDPDAEVVFGYVVRAPVARLQSLANERGVRLVDVGPAEEAGPEVVYRGLRPEETSKANSPPTRALREESRPLR